ncbi:MAG: hypothetical protein NVSMB25_16400 [Thermoleophilaceae bacterium]
MDAETRMRPRAKVEVDDLVHALRSYGCLTRERLSEVSGAKRWPDHTFSVALRRGVGERRIRSLGADLYELEESERIR